MAERRDRLDDVTRPRPSIGPALAGAVDLSGLKQRAQQNASAGPASGPPSAEPAGRRPGSADHSGHRGQLRRRGDRPVRRSAGGGAAVVTAQRRLRRAGRHAVRPGRCRQRQVVAGDGQRRRGTQGGPDIRCRGGPDRGGFGRRDSRSQVSRVCSRPISCGAGWTPCFRRQPESSGVQRVPRNPRKSIRSWRRPVSSSRPATSRPRESRIRRSWMPIRAASKPRPRSGRSNSSRAQPRNDRTRSPIADAAPDDIEAAFAAADVADPQSGCQRGVRASDCVGAQHIRR